MNGSYIVCPAVGKNLSNSDITANLVWIGLLFDLNKGVTDQYGFVEGDIAMLHKLLECLGSENKRLLIRIASPVSEVCNGFRYPKSIVVRIPWGLRPWLELGSDRADQAFVIPVYIILQYIQSGQRVLISNYGLGIFTEFQIQVITSIPRPGRTQPEFLK